MTSPLQAFLNLGFKTHLVLSLVIRLALIAYGEFHDGFFNVKYTDIDYKVFTDAANHILNNKSPYERHTYRYSPLIAISQIPNILIHPTFGKVLFSLVDVAVALLIRSIVVNSLKEFQSHAKTDLEIDFKKKKNARHSNKQKISFSKGQLNCKSELDRKADFSMYCWLYNPLTIAIGTRGNCDSLAGFLVLITLYILQCRKLNFLAGIFHGFSVHFRLYPIVYSLSMFMYLSNFSEYSITDRRLRQVKENGLKCIRNATNNEIIRVTGNQQERKTIFKKQYLYYLLPNVEQLKLISGCILSLSILTSVFYYLFGYTFLYETYIYHFIRKDIRHNFSLYFYLQYLTAWVKNIGMWQSVLIGLPQIVLLVVFSIRYGLNRYSMNFSILTQTIVLVIYNRVITSQYFVWIMAILPLCMWQIQMPRKTAVFLIGIWFAAQAAWLLPAYLLEFQGQNTFFFIWIQSVSFFCANIAILGRLIMYFVPNDKKLV